MCRTVLNALGMGRTEGSALTNQIGANMPSVNCLPHSYPFKYASLGQTSEDKAPFFLLLFYTEMAVRVPLAQL